MAPGLSGRPAEGVAEVGDIVPLGRRAAPVVVISGNARRCRPDDNGNRVPLDVAVGDRVIYSKYGGTEVKFDGDEFLVLSARDVLAVVVR